MFTFLLVKETAFLKKWERAWKIRLIEKKNPNWHDLHAELTGFPPSRE